MQPEFTCDDTSGAGCKRTQFAWNETTGLLDSKTSNGWSYNASNALQAFTSTTSYSYDTVGRLTQVDGPLAGTDDVTQFTIWSSADVFKDGYTNLVKRKKDTTNFLTTTLDDYDYFGNAKSTQDPDGTFTCRTWDGNRNYLSQVREAMAAQTSCATTNAADLTTTYVRDTALRLTQTTHPVGDCEIQDYDATWGRLTNTKRRDDCNAASGGETRTDYYDANGYNEKTELLNASSTVTKRIMRATLDGTQLGSMTNPVTPAYARTFAYFADAKMQTLTFENSLGMTEYLWDSQNRQTTNRRLDSPGLSLDWVLGYPQSGATSSKQYSAVTDPASKTTTTLYDDLGRKNRTISPDTGTTLYVYDAASRLLTEVIGYSSGAPRTSTFTYDNIGRRLTENYDDLLDNCTRTSPITELTYVYDASPITCPGTALCTKQMGRLAYVKSALLCDASKPDFTLDQETFMAYDDAGRVTQEYLQDDSTRTADQRYAWDKNGNLKEVTAPSAASMTYTLGGAGNSDANRVVTVARTVGGTPTNLLTGITWAPFGPVAQYDQANTISGNAIRATFTWNLAYRATQIKYAATGAQKTTVDFTEDEKGRYTQKLYSNVDAGMQNSYLAYDFFDRPWCDAAVSGACPTSGTNLRSNVTYNTSNDRSSFYHQHSQYGGTNQYALTYTSGTDKIASFTQTSPSGTTSVGYTAYGYRASEDNTNSSADRRDYFYDHRMRVRTITGKWFSSAGFINDYTVTYAYDHKNRLVYRSYATSSTASQTFYYYDLQDRLIEVKNIPNTASPSTYSVYNFYWLEHSPVAMWATDFPSGTVGRYFMHTDEANRVLEVYSWPTSGDATRVWALNPDQFGWDVTVTSSLAYQPLRLNNAILDDQIRAPQSFNAFDHVTTYNRPGLLVDRGAILDPMLETSLQPTRGWPDESYTTGEHALGLHRLDASAMFAEGSDGQNCAIATRTARAATEDGCVRCSASTTTMERGIVVGGIPPRGGMRCSLSGCIKGCLSLYGPQLGYCFEIDMPVWAKLGCEVMIGVIINSCLMSCFLCGDPIQ